MAEPKVSKTFGKVLQKLRRAQKLSQEKLAEKAQIHPTHVGLIERGLRNPSLDVSAGLAAALGLSLSEMILQAEKLEKATTSKRNLHES